MTEPAETGASLYAQAGVDALAKAGGLADIGDRVTATFSYRSGLGRPLLPLGYFANVIDLADGRGLAISTDNVGTKVLVAQMMGRYDTVGIDCVAINVNDLLCVGAEPLSLVDYIAAERADQEQLAQIAAGLCEGARQSRISISGGETAQVAELSPGRERGLRLRPVRHLRRVGGPGPARRRPASGSRRRGDRNGQQRDPQQRPHVGPPAVLRQAGLQRQRAPTFAGA